MLHSQFTVIDALQGRGSRFMMAARWPSATACWTSYFPYSILCLATVALRLHQSMQPLLQAGPVYLVISSLLRAATTSMRRRALANIKETRRLITLPLSQTASWKMMHILPSTQIHANGREPPIRFPSKISSTRFGLMHYWTTSCSSNLTTVSLRLLHHLPVSTSTRPSMRRDIQQCIGLQPWAP